MSSKRLEQQAAPPHKRQHGWRGQQLPVHLRSGEPLRHRLTVSLKCPHPSRALTLATHTHCQPAQFEARRAAQDDARAPPPRRDQREGVLRSLDARLADRGRVAQAATTRPARPSGGSRELRCAAPWHRRRQHGLLAHQAAPARCAVPRLGTGSDDAACSLIRRLPRGALCRG